MTLSRMFSSVLAVTLCVSVAVAAPPQEPFRVTQEGVDLLLAQIVPAVEAELGVELAATARLATTMEIALVLKQENTPLMAAQLGDDEAGERSAGIFGLNLSPALLAKYAFAEREILVNAENFENVALLLDRDYINSEASLRTVLVHELIHLADDAHYGFSETLLGLEDGPSINAYSAVFEGHAQFVARRVCETNGWGEDFERFTANIGYLPDEVLEDMDLRQALAARLSASNFRTSYYAGERFVTALFEAGAEAEVERAFRSPPANLQLILNPEWYLDPSSRPEVEFEVEAALDLFGNEFPSLPVFDLSGDAEPTEAWNHVRMDVLKPQIGAVMTGIPQPLIDRTLESIVTSRLEVATQGGGEKMVMGVLYVMTSAPESASFVDVSRQLSLIKDGNMTPDPGTTASVSLLSSEYVEIEDGVTSGFAAVKRLSYMEQEVPVLLVVMYTDTLVCELTYSNFETDLEEAVRVGKQVLARAAGLQSFEGARPSAGWSVAETASTGTPATWSVEADPRAPDGEHVLRVVAANGGHTFNLFLDEAPRPADLALRVSLRADSGVEDQGGGLCWRVQDADNYYVTRWNPLEDNLRVYKVEGGERHELQSAEVRADPAAWHELEVSMVGAHIRVRFDGEELLSVDDKTFEAAGRAGLWTKADASVSFDGYSAR